MGTRTPGKIRNRLLATTLDYPAKRVGSSQPIHASRGASRHAGALKLNPPTNPASQATRYRSCAPHNGPAPNGWCACIIARQVLDNSACPPSTGTSHIRPSSVSFVSMLSQSRRAGADASAGLANETVCPAGSAMTPRRDNLSKATRQLISFGCPSAPCHPIHVHTSRDSAVRVSVASPSTRERIRSSISSEKSRPATSMKIG